jgi:hypothetical protein
MTIFNHSTRLAKAAMALAFFSFFPSLTAKAAIEPLVIRETQFENPSGVPVRFWGMNLVSMYPTRKQAEGIAADLAERGFNIARLHHNMRASLDWNPQSGIAALAKYETDTRAPDKEAWERFDYLDAQLRKRGIYIALSLHSTRRYLPGDADILATNAADRAAWMRAMDALRRMPKNLDLFKMLPVIDERCALLMEEFAGQLLTHVNPHTGLDYGSDPQVLFLEVLNEASTEYAIVCGNRFAGDEYPEVKYWAEILQSKWDAFADANNIGRCDLYAPKTDAQKQLRGRFLRELDAAFFKRIKALVRGLGCDKPVELSNLWRGDAFQKMEDSLSDLVEEHNYCDPLVTRAPADAFSYFSRSTPVGKPYFIGELNQSENKNSLATNIPYRTMMPVAMSAYGSFNNWSGIAWFAWAHGDRSLDSAGHASTTWRRPPDNAGMVGCMMADGMMLDHMRTAGLIFKRGLISPSKTPLLWHADEPFAAGDYNALMTPKNSYKDGWQSIHAIKCVFAPEPPLQAGAPWMHETPENPLVSDTKEITKDTERNQLSVSAPQAEAFSGKLDSRPPAGLAHIGIAAETGFATIIIVAADDRPIAESKHLIISRTHVRANGKESAKFPAMTLARLSSTDGKNIWCIKRTRPKVSKKMEPLAMHGGVLTLPSDGWHEAELIYAPTN